MPQPMQQGTFIVGLRRRKPVFVMAWRGQALTHLQQAEHLRGEKEGIVIGFSISMINQAVFV